LEIERHIQADLVFRDTATLFGFADSLITFGLMRMGSARPVGPYPPPPNTTPIGYNKTSASKIQQVHVLRRNPRHRTTST
jgi:hypothetical protein